MTSGSARPVLPGEQADGAFLTPRALAGYWLELAGVWNIAVAWPVYQNIASGPEALTGLGLRRLDLLLLVVLVSLVVPTLGVLAESLVNRLGGETPRKAVHAGLIASIVAVFTWHQVMESVAIVRLLLPALAAGIAAVLLLRSAFGQNFFRILGGAVPAVIVLFCLRYPVWAEVGPHDKQVEEGRLGATTPVVLVIFDELPLASLENEEGKIDGELFPAFADLASGSTWYPDMTGVADQTTFAVPSIMTGSSPVPPEYTVEPPPPGLPDFPDGVCSVAEGGGYTVHAYEPITDLCPRTFGIGSRITAAIRRGAGGTGELQGKDLDPFGAIAAGSDLLAAPFSQPWAEYGDERDDAVDWFISGMPDSERSLSVLHVALPHIQWEYLPDGTRYESNRFDGVSSLTSPPTRPEVNHDMQQEMLQLAFTDRELARIIGKMKADGIWDESLFIVTADHGGAFLPAGSRRIASRTNSGWIMPVPLFIKYPGQSAGKEVRGAANSKDIAPTIFESIGAENPPRVDGQSLAGRSRLARCRDGYEFRSALGQISVSCGSVTRQFRRAREQRNALFGGGSLYAIGGHRDLIGRAPSVVPGLTPLLFTDESPQPMTDLDLEGPDRPSYFKAVLGRPLREGTAIAVALNDKIVATTSAWADAAGVPRTGVNLPPKAFVEGDNEVRLYEVQINR